MALLVVVLILSLAPAGGASAAPSSNNGSQAGVAAERPAHLAGLRLGRPESFCGGLFELADHPGVCSHGPDPSSKAGGSAHGAGAGEGGSSGSTETAAGGTSTTAAAGGGDLPRSPATATNAMPCVGDGVSGNRVEMIYAHAADVPDRFSTYARTLQNYGNDVAAAFVRSAQRSGGPDVHVRFLTSSDCRPVIRSVKLSAQGDDTFNNTISEVKALGYNRSDRTYLIWTDANVYCGIATMIKDDRKSGQNANNSGASYSRVDNQCWNGPTAAHELAHNFGAIQASAPHATAGGHCTDEYDLMCYSDGRGVTMSYPCAEAGDVLFDCNHDDYFSANPKAGSYLANHWNMANNCRLTLVPCGSDNTLKVMPADTTPPATPAGLVLAPVNSTSMTLRWDPTDDDVGVAGYRIKRDGGAAYWYLIGGTSITDTGVRSGVVYSYTVEAYDGAGNISKMSAPVTGETDRTAPTVPTELLASAVSNSSVDLTWRASTDNVGVTGYRIYRDGVARGTTATTAYRDTALTPGATHAYTVTALDRAGNESAASTAVRVTAPLDGTPPSVPQSLSSPAQTASAITLSWTSSTDNVGVAGYRIFRNGLLVQTTSDTTVRDSGLTLNTSYRYTVMAFDAAGNTSGHSGQLTVRTKLLCSTAACL